MAEINFAPNLGEIFEVPASQVNLFRSINSPGYTIGDIAITAAGATYEWDGDSWNSISVGGGAGAAQTPWTSNINGGGFNLTNVGQINVTQVVMDALTTNTLLVNGETSFVPVGASAILVTDASSVLQASVVTLTELGHLTGVTSAIQTQLNLKAILGANTFTALQTITQGTANAGILASTGYSLTGSNATSMLDLAGTWNTTGNPVALKLAISNTASGATSKFLSFLAGAAGATEVFAVDKTGALFLGGATGTNSISVTSGTSLNLMGLLQVSGSTGNTTISSAFALNWGSSAFATPDTFLFRDAANTLALRNSTNAQAFRVYNTTDAGLTNYERASIGWASNALRIGTEFAGTGTGRVIEFTFNGTAIWKFSTGGHLLANADNTYDIGASGATRPRTIYAGTGFVGPLVLFNSFGRLTSASDGVLTLLDNATTSFGRLQFGGTTSSFPSWKRSSAQLHCRLADDSADAVLQALQLNVAGTQVIGAQRTGWSAATGGATRTTFDTASVTLPQLAERMKAWLDDALVHGLIGA